MLEIHALTYNDLAPVVPVAGAIPAEGGTVGRGEDNAITLPDPLRLVSRRHLEFVPDAAGGFRVSNISSSNLVLVNDEELDPGMSCRVRDGDRITLGGYLLTVGEGGRAAAQPAAPVLDDLLGDPLPVSPGEAAFGVPASAAAPISEPLTDPLSEPLGVHEGLLAEPVSGVEPDDFLGDLLGNERAVSAHPIPAADPATLADPFDQPLRRVPVDPIEAMGDQGLDLASFSGKADELINGADASEMERELLRDPLGSGDVLGMQTASVDPLSMFRSGWGAGSGGLGVVSGLGLGGERRGSSNLNHGSELDGLMRLPTAAQRLAPADDIGAILGQPASAPDGPPVAPAASATQSAAPLIPDDLDDLFADLAPSAAPPATPPAANGLGPAGGIARHAADARPEAVSRIAAVPGQDALIPEDFPIVPDEVPAQPPFADVRTAAEAQPSAGPNVAAMPELDDLLFGEPGMPAADIDELLAASPSPGLAPQDMLAMGDAEARHVAVSPEARPAAVQVSPQAAPQQRGGGRAESDANSGAEDELYKALLQGLALESLPDRNGLDKDFMRLIGQLLRSCAQGTVDLMAARAAVRREVKANVTLIAPESNNPLKFSPDGEVALLYLLGKPYPGFMRPVEAVNHAYADLRAHQIGVVSGMRSALNHVLERFDPEVIDREAMRAGLVDSLLAIGRKARLWEAYGRYFAATREEAEDRFQSFFGSAFLDAYEEASSVARAHPPRRQGERS